MGNMKEESLLRLSISLDEHAPTTLEKYICYLVEDVLFCSDKNALPAIEICQNINKEFGLLFDIAEIQNALKRKAKKDIILHDGLYSLVPKTREKLKKQIDMSDALRLHVEKYTKETNTQIEKNALCNLFIKYLYYCFNSNIKNFLSLLGENGKNPIPKFDVTNDEVDVINAFLQWDDEEKNKFLYSIVSFSYEYCMV